MNTRRGFLQQALIAPALMVASYGPSRTMEIIREDDWLSEESARGFALLPPAERALVVVCGGGDKALTVAPQLQRQAANGSWILWEGMPYRPEQARVFEQTQRVLSNIFGVDIGKPFAPGLYVEYVWPKRTLVRSFLTATRVSCVGGTVVARCSGNPVAVAHSVGRGGFVYLGSMLGPSLYAEDLQARAIAADILHKVGSLV